MKIVVCVKRVPDTTTALRIGADGKSIDESGVQWVMNPYDEYALEEALRAKEKAGSGEVILLALGPAETQAILRNGMAMGADRSILLKTDAKNWDPWSIASALAEQIKPLGADLVLFGKQAVDGDFGQVGSIVAGILGLPVASVVVKLEINGKDVVATREIEGGLEHVAMSLPAVASLQKLPYEPRFASLKGIMAAKKKPIEEKAAPAPSPKLEIVKIENPPQRPAGRIVGKGTEAVPELVRLLRDEAKVL